MSRISDILGRVIDLESLVQKQPEMFDLVSLDISEKIRLLQDKPKIFIGLLAPTITDPEDKRIIIINVTHRVVRDAIELTEEDLEKLSNESYFHLLSEQFKKYVRPELFKKLPAKRKSSLTAMNPKWVFENIVPAPKLTSEVLAGMAKRFPEIVDRYVTDFSDVATTVVFWRSMIKHDPKYKSIFLRNTKSLITKTDVRGVIRSFPGLIKELDEEIIADSKLTVKEWVLLCDSISGHKDLEGWEFSDEMKEIFRLDSLADLLSGKAKLSKRFSNAMSSIK